MPYQWPDLRTLELLIAVADQGGIGAAARHLGIAQPNASRMISALEHDVGASLVTRSPRGATLTPTGEHVAAQAAILLDAARTFDANVEALTSGSTPLAIAASLTIAVHLLPRWLAQLRRSRPGLEVTMSAQNSGRVFDLVSDGSCALGFVETPLARKNLHSRVVARDELVVVVAPPHPWAVRKEPLTAAELAATALVVREPMSGTRVTLERALGDHGPCTVAVELGSNEAVVASIRTGLEPGVVSALAVRDQLARGELIQVPVAPEVDLHRKLRAVWRGSAPTGGAAALMDIAVRELNDRADK